MSDYKEILYEKQRGGVLITMSLARRRNPSQRALSATSDR